jgi:hypothetical protein
MVLFLNFRSLGIGNKLKEENLIFGVSSITTIKVAVGFGLRTLLLVIVCFLGQILSL